MIRCGCRRYRRIQFVEDAEFFRYFGLDRHLLRREHLNRVGAASSAIRVIVTLGRVRVNTHIGFGRSAWKLHGQNRSMAQVKNTASIALVQSQGMSITHAPEQKVHLYGRSQGRTAPNTYIPCYQKGHNLDRFCIRSQLLRMSQSRDLYCYHSGQWVGSAPPRGCHRIP